MKVKTTIRTYGSASKKHPGAIKVGNDVIQLLKRVGWSYYRKPSAYAYDLMMPPADCKNKKTVEVEIDVPSETEFLEIAQRMRTELPPEDENGFRELEKKISDATVIVINRNGKTWAWASVSGTGWKLKADYIHGAWVLRGEE